jgi:serine/threonine protein kinase
MSADGVKHPRGEARVGSIVADKYELVALLGAGGSSAVYEARHRKTDGRYALKVLDAPPNSHEAERMLREARALAKLAHPNIVRLIDFDEHEGTVFIVEELLRGKTLRAALDEALVLSAREALEWLVPVLRALAYAHGQGVIHRDVKPENIILSEEGGEIVPRLVDFGLVRELSTDTSLTRHNTLLGTPRYMSPEQAWGRLDVDARSDLWSFAAVLYECLAGVPPYDGGSEREVLAAIVSKDPLHLRAAAVPIDEELADAVMFALERAPEARCPSAVALEQRLASIESFAGQPWFEALFAAHKLRKSEAARAEPAASRRAQSIAPSAPSTNETRAALPGPASGGRWLAASLTIAVVAAMSLSFVRSKPSTTAMTAASGSRGDGPHRADAAPSAASVGAPSDAASAPTDAHDFNQPDAAQTNLDDATTQIPDRPLELRATRARTRDAAAGTPVYTSQTRDAASRGANAAPIVDEL